MSVTSHTGAILVGIGLMGAAVALAAPSARPAPAAPWTLPAAPAADELAYARACVQFVEDVRLHNTPGVVLPVTEETDESLDPTGEVAEWSQILATRAAIGQPVTVEEKAAALDGLTLTPAEKAAAWDLVQASRAGPR